MKEHAIITKLRHPLENFTAHDLDELIKAYDEVNEVCNAAIAWWKAQELSDTEFRHAENELSLTVGNYIRGN